ncbi:MAG: YihY/virulence factor BrkB family protein [Actinomycetota bacterium]
MDRVVEIAKRAYAFGRRIAGEWSSDRVGGLSAEIAFFALLGFFPTVIALAAALGSADAVVGENTASDVETWLVDQMINVFGGENTLESTVRELFTGGNGSALTFGLLIAFYAASRGFTAVVRALDVAYDHDHLRGWLSTRLVGFALTLVTVLVAAVVLVLIVVGPLFGEGSEIADDLGVAGWVGTLWTWLRWPVVFLVLVAWAATVYHVAPNHTSPWRTELPGAVIAAVWWSAVSLGFNTYLSVASSGANAIFGLLGGAISLLFWLYLMAMGLLLGAEVNSLLAVDRGLDLNARPGSARGEATSVESRGD